MTAGQEQDPRRNTPRTDAVLAHPDVLAHARGLSRQALRAVVVDVLAACRRGDIPPHDVVRHVVAGLPARASSLQPVVNATGVVVHTNLGRAPLSHAATQALQDAAGATDIEFDLRSGRRGPRGAGALRALAAAVPAAGAVHVVNNGAAALALAVAALAGGRHAVIARGELVEIGDGFRIPELLESAGAQLREVGTTNRVSLSDYAAAVDDRTAVVLKIHPSNFRVEGFTSSVPISALTTLGLPVVADIGSGLLSPHPRLPDEPDAASALRSGATLVTASGDKLLGGPQCGLVLGDADVIAQLRRHPLARALRAGKLTLAALEATLVGPAPPVMQALGRDQDDLIARARAICTAVAPAPATATTTDGRVGGGGAPGVVLPSAAVVLPTSWAQPLRNVEPPVVGRVREGRLLLDLLAVDPEQDEALIRAIRSLAVPETR